MTTTLSPRRVSKRAALLPAGPPPTITTSCVCIMLQYAVEPAPNRLEHVAACIAPEDRIGVAIAFDDLQLDALAEMAGEPVICLDLRPGKDAVRVAADQQH